jgi:hypothetical protein
MRGCGREQRGAHGVRSGQKERLGWGKGYERVAEQAAILIFRKRDASAQVLTCKLKYLLKAFLSLLYGTLFWIV